MTSRALLALNAGSSSLKFAIFEDSEALALLARGQIEDLDRHPLLKVRDIQNGSSVTRPFSETRFESVLAELLDWVDGHLADCRLTAVGHRIVHGGARWILPQVVTPELLHGLEALTPLAPLHQPHNLLPIRAIAVARPDLKQVASFDTAFHHTIPAVATRFALPRDYEAKGVRRYGFHGLSYEYVSGQLLEVAPDIAQKKVIVAHLGNGASLCALQAGRSMDTTMGFSALDGLVMGTRCGALDPGVVLYLTQSLGLSPNLVSDLLYKQSGLLGVSGISSDMRELLASSDPRASEAIELFVFHVSRQIAALAATLGGLDALVFTAGIGENSAEIRRRVGAAAYWLGVNIDESSNLADKSVISALDSGVKVFVIPTDEELVIARHTRRALQHV
jgi:acetate kinase